MHPGRCPPRRGTPPRPTPRPRSSTAANTWPAPATVSPATPRRTASAFAGGRPMATPFGALYVPNITPDDETGIGKWTADDFYRMMHTGVSQDGTLLYPAMPFASYTKVTRDGLRRHLRLPDVGDAGEAAEPAARTAASRSTTATCCSAGARCTSRKANTSPTRSRSARMEPRRLPGAGPGPLRDVPHGHQRAGRLERIEGLRGRHDSEPELVRAVAHVQPRSRAWATGTSRTSPTCCRSASRIAAPPTGRWPRWSTTACST